MRWEELFTDLEGRAAALAAEDGRAEIADRTRWEVGQVSLVNRLRAQAGRPLTATVVGAGEVTGRLARVGPDHLLLECGGWASGGELLVVLAAVEDFRDLSPEARTAETVGVAEGRLGLASLLRGVSADRSVVSATLRRGPTYHGTLGRVGADWVDLLEHPHGTVARSTEVLRQRTLPFDALAAVRRLGR